MGNNTNIETLTLSDGAKELLEKLRRMIFDHIPAAALGWMIEALDDFAAAVYADGANAATTDADSGDSTDTNTDNDNDTDAENENSEGSTNTNTDNGDGDGEDNTDDTTGNKPGEGE